VESAAAEAAAAEAAAAAAAGHLSEPGAVAWLAADASGSAESLQLAQSGFQASWQSGAEPGFLSGLLPGSGGASPRLFTLASLGSQDVSGLMGPIEPAPPSAAGAPWPPPATPPPLGPRLLLPAAHQPYATQAQPPLPLQAPLPLLQQASAALLAQELQGLMANAGASCARATAAAASARRADEAAAAAARQAVAYAQSMGLPLLELAALLRGADAPAVAPNNAPAARAPLAWGGGAGPLSGGATLGSTPYAWGASAASSLPAARGVTLQEAGLQPAQFVPLDDGAGAFFATAPAAAEPAPQWVVFCEAPPAPPVPPAPLAEQPGVPLPALLFTWAAAPSP
jgi:hypothetical protein